MAKLILTNEVAGLGSAGDVVEVRSGYARNYLIPQGYATAWTRGGAKQVESIQAARKARAIHDREEAVALKDAIEGQKVRLTVKAGTGGRLFGSVKTDHVAEAVEASGLGSIDKRKVTITSPIKSTGDHEATVRLHEDVIAVITLQVVAAK
ncbi:MAG: 50S ribosomal protein L9 [Microbacteriaceae bacterium]|uniref:50S ribosomal protein L9 n=1 Tax=Microbacterium sp. TaxID=51671 RepID=UPI003F9A280B